MRAAVADLLSGATMLPVAAEAGNYRLGETVIIGIVTAADPTLWTRITACTDAVLVACRECPVVACRQHQ